MVGPVGGFSGAYDTSSLEDENKRKQEEASKAQGQNQSSGTESQQTTDTKNTSSEEINSSRNATAIDRNGYPALATQMPGNSGLSQKTEQPKTKGQSAQATSLTLFPQDTLVPSRRLPLLTEISSHESLKETQAQRYQHMTREEQQDHTLELMSNHLDAIDKSSLQYLNNEKFIADLEALKKQQSQKQTVNPFQDVLKPSDRSINPLAMPLSIDQKQQLSPEMASFLQRNLGNPSKEAISQEIELRTQLREKLVDERTNLLTTQGNVGKLAANGQADLIHLLFDGQGKPLNAATISARSWDSSFPAELKNKYSQLDHFLKRDLDFEQEFKSVQETFLGLSPEEQAVKMRDFIGERILGQRDQLIALREQESGLDRFLNNSWRQNLSSSSQDQSEIMTIDQRIISNIAKESLGDNLRSLYGLHDKLTEALNTRQFGDASKVIESAREDIDQGFYIRGRDDAETTLVNRDISKTPKEKQEAQEKITELEQEFEKLSQTELERARQLIFASEKETKATLDIVRNSSNPFGGNFWRLMHNETDLMFKGIEKNSDHAGRLIENIKEQKTNLRQSQQSLAQTGLNDKYQRDLVTIIQAAKEGKIEVGLQASKDLSQLGQEYQDLDQAYGRTETGLRFTRNAAIIAAATIATGGSAAYLSSTMGYGYGAAGITAFGIGGSAGTVIGLASNLAEGYSREQNGFTNPYENVLSQTYQDAKTSFITAAGTATGLSSTKALAETFKWGRLASTLTGSASSSVLTTSMNHGIGAGESYLQTGETNFDGKEYLKDLLWNTGSSLAGSSIGYKFNTWQSQGSQGLARQGFLHSSEEATSIASDLLITQTRALTEGKQMTAEDFLQTFQSSIIGRVNAHYSGQVANRNLSNPVAESIRDQKNEIANTSLPEGMDGTTKVRVKPDGSRSVEIKISNDTASRAASGDERAQKTIIEETLGHGRERPVDPLVKQADGSLKPMSHEQYMALRARQELVQRSVAEGIYAREQGQSVSSAKQGLKATIQAIETHIRQSNYAEAMKIAEENGIGNVYREQFAKDYEHNVNPNREHLEQTSFSSKAEDLEQQRQDVLSQILGQINQVITNQRSRVRTSNELTNRDLTDSINQRIQDIKPSDIKTLIQKTEELGIDANVARETLSQMSQFGNLRSLTNLVDQLGIFKDQGYRIITDSKGSLGDVISYLGEKGNYKIGDNASAGNIFPTTTRLSSLLKIDPVQLASFDPPVTKIAILLDAIVLDTIRSNPHIQQHLKTVQEQGLEIKLIHPRGWNDGINPFTTDTNMQTRLNEISTRAQALMETEGINSAEAISRALDQNVQAEITKLGLLENFLVVENASKTNARPSNEELAEGLNGKMVSEEQIQRIVENIYKIEDQEAVREIIARDLQIISTREIAKITQMQHQEILELAKSKGISPENIYFSVLHRGKPKSDSIMMQIYQQTNGISSSQIINKANQLPSDPNTMVVLVDDVSISGQTQMQIHAQIRAGYNYQGEIVMAPTIVTSQAIRNLMDPSQADTNIINEALLNFSGVPHYQEATRVLQSPDPKLHMIEGHRYTPLQQTSYFQGLSTSAQQRLLHLMQYSGRGHNGDSTSIIMPWMAPNNNNGLVQVFSRLITLSGNGVKTVTKQEARKRQEENL
jgi:hypothetical protein